MRPEELLSDDSPLALEEALYDRLSPVARRQSWLQRWLLWAAVLAGATVAGLALQAMDERWGWGGAGWWVLLLLALVGALVAAHWRVEHDPPDLRALALRIERAHPELRGVLLTAIAQLPEGMEGRFGYLQEQVMREAVAPSLPADWSRAIPNARLWGAGALCGLAMAAFVWVAARTWLPELQQIFADEYGLSVSPGNGEVERGTTATVLARFAGKVPTRATLLVRPRGKAPLRVPMSRNLADPVFAAAAPVEDGIVDYQIEYASRRSRRYRLTSFVLPDLDRVDARVVYPRQPSIAPKEIDDVRQVIVAEGARVSLTVRLNKPVAEARMVADDGSVVILAPSGGRGDVQTATLDPDRTRRYEVQLRDERRRSNRSPPRLVLEVHGNAAPKIALSFPGHDVRVSPIEELTVEAAVSDDVGLTGYGVSYSLAGKPSHDVTLGGGNARTQTARLVIPLEDLGAQPDDLVSYHFWAEDVAGNGERRRVWSDMYFAEVRPFEERFQEGPSSAAASGTGAGGGQPAVDLARREKELINATWRLLREEREGVPAQELGNDIEVVRKGQMEVKEAADEARAQALGETRTALDAAIVSMVRAHGQLAVDLSKGLEAEQSAYAALLRLRQRDHQVVRGERGAGSGGNATPADRALDELELKSQGNRYETRPEAQAQDDPAREDRQVLNRLRDLAERQKTLTERIKELQVALQQAKTQEREELERRLKRLREEQQEMLGDLDDLLQRMDRPENRSRLAEARDDLEKTRGRAAETSEALARGETGRAVGAGTRTERALDRMRETLSRKVSHGLGDELRELREQAEKLNEAQNQLGGQIRRAVDPKRAAATPTEGRALAQALRQQRQSLSTLLDRMRRITEESEASSPLLTRKLYDAYRRAKMDGVEKALDRMSDLFDHGFGPQAAPEEAKAREGLANLQKGVTDAAKGVVGDDAAALKLAQSELQSLIEEARRGAQAPGAAGQTPGGAANSSRAGAGQTPRGAAGGSQAGTPTPGAARGEAPFLGENFRTWAERLRDVQELFDDPGLRTDAGRVLDRARVLRGEAQRHGEAPQWSLLETEVVRPLSELRDKVNEELRRVVPEKDSLAPIDRDPVPSRYSDLVRRYWKSLSKD